MRRLRHLTVFTQDVTQMRRFYERGLGLRPRRTQPRWTAYDTAGVTLALHPVDGGAREIGLTFESTALDLEAEAMRTHEVRTPGAPGTRASGKVIHLRDPEGNLLSVLETPATVDAGSGPRIATVILNCRDLPSTSLFYRDTLGLEVAYETTHWTELEVEGTRIALHARPQGLDHPLHAAQRIAWCFEAVDLNARVEDLRGRGVHFATAPTDDGFGAYAEVIDPDGNVVVFREPSEAPPLEETLAEPYEDETAPSHAGIHRSVKRATRATSRVVNRPEYKVKKSTARKRPSATTQAVAKVRGGGPNRTRQMPKRTADEKRAKALPGIGRHTKSEQQRAQTKKSAAAGASRGKPVKRAAARTARGKTTRRSTGSR